MTQDFFEISKKEIVLDMLNIFTLKKNDPAGSTATSSNRTSAAILRVTKGSPSVLTFVLREKRSHLDLSELATLPPTCQVTYPNKDDLLHFTLTIIPDDVNRFEFEKKDSVSFVSFGF